MLARPSPINSMIAKRTPPHITTTTTTKGKILHDRHPHISMLSPEAYPSHHRTHRPRRQPLIVPTRLFSPSSMIPPRLYHPCHHLEVSMGTHPIIHKSSHRRRRRQHQNPIPSPSRPSHRAAPSLTRIGREAQRHYLSSSQDKRVSRLRLETAKAKKESKVPSEQNQPYMYHFLRHRHWYKWKTTRLPRPSSVLPMALPVNISRKPNEVVASATYSEVY